MSAHGSDDSYEHSDDERVVNVSVSKTTTDSVLQKRMSSRDIIQSEDIFDVSTPEKQQVFTEVDEPPKRVVSVLDQLSPLGSKGQTPFENKAKSQTPSAALFKSPQKKSTGQDQPRLNHMSANAIEAVYQSKLEPGSVSLTPILDVDRTLCWGCETATAKLFCVQCKAKYCADCDRKVHILKNKRDHKRVDAKNGAAVRPNLCSDHKTQCLEFYCMQCDEAVCIFCRDYGDHRGHELALFSQLAADKRVDLRQQAEEIYQSTALATKLLGEIGATLQNLSDGDQNFLSIPEGIKHHIDELFDKLVIALNSRRDELLNDLDYAATEKHEQLEYQKDALLDIIKQAAELRGGAVAVLSESPLVAADKYTITSTDIERLASKPVLRFVEPVEDSALHYILPEECAVAIGKFGAIGGPDFVTFDVDSLGMCSVSWGAPVEHRIGTFSENEAITYNVGAVIARPKRYEDDEEILEHIGIGQPESLHDLSMVFNVRDFVNCKFGVRVRANFANQSHSAWTTSPVFVQLPSRFTLKTFSFVSNFDGSGLFHWIGTEGHNSTYVNPHAAGYVHVSWSSVGDGDICNFVSLNDPRAYSYTLNEPNSWMAVDIGAGRTLCPSGYSLRHDMQGTRGALRNWIFEGGNIDRFGNIDWVTLSTHENDTTLVAKEGSTAYFKIEDSPSAYRYFRIFQTGKNSSGKHRLACAGLELYGSYSF